MGSQLRSRLNPIEYQVGDVWIRVTANAKSGLAAIWDTNALGRNTADPKRATAEYKRVPIPRFYPYELLKAIRRAPAGEIIVICAGL